MLIVVLGCQGVFAGGVVVEVGDRLVADEVGRPGDEGIENMGGVQGDVLRIGYEPLALFALGSGRIKESQRYWIDSASAPIRRRRSYW